MTAVAYDDYFAPHKCVCMKLQFELHSATCATLKDVGRTVRQANQNLATPVYRYMGKLTLLSRHERAARWLLT